MLWRSEVSHHPLLLSALWFEAGSLLEPVAHPLTLLTGQEASGTCTSVSSSAGVTAACTPPHPDVYMGRREGNGSPRILAACT